MENHILGFALRMKGSQEFFLTRKVIKDGSDYFGPYTNIKTINTLIDLINNIYPIRKTNYNLK